MENLRVYAQEYAVMTLLLALETGTGCALAFFFPDIHAGERRRKEQTADRMKALLRAARYVCGGFAVSIVVHLIRQGSMTVRLSEICGRAAMAAAGILAYQSVRWLHWHRPGAFLAGAGIFAAGVCLCLQLSVRPPRAGRLLYTAGLFVHGILYMLPYAMGEWWLKETAQEKERGSMNRML